jgi:hypothetical protein
MTYYLANQQIAEFKHSVRSLGPRYPHTFCCSRDLTLLAPRLQPPVVVELRAVTRLSAFWTREISGNDSARTERASPIWSEERRELRTILVLASYPDDYAVVITDPTVAQEAEEALAIKTLLVGRHYGNVDWVYTGRFPIVGRLQVLDPADASILWDTAIEISPTPTPSPRSLTMPVDWRAGFVNAVADEDIEVVQIRILPDRETALSRPQVSAYLGRVIEREVQVEFTASEFTASE